MAINQNFTDIPASNIPGSNQNHPAGIGEVEVQENTMHATAHLSASLTIEDCAELVSLQEARRCIAVTLDYLEEREAVILERAAARQAETLPDTTGSQATILQAERDERQDEAQEN